MKRAVILSAVPVTAALRRYLAPGDFVAACDAGYRNAAVLGVVPDLIVGDFDSAPRPQAESEKTIVLPHVKDDTDTMFAAKWLLARGFEEIVMLGALGGARIEHTLANLSVGLFATKQGARVVLADERSELRYLTPAAPLTLARADWKYLSLYALGGPLTGVEMRGTFYPLHGATLTAQDGPLTTSNEFTAPAAELRCTGGTGLAVLTRDDAAAPSF